MEQSFQEQSVLKKNSFKNITISVVIIGVILLFSHYWYTPMIGRFTGAIVFWIMITAIIIVALLLLWNTGIQARAEERDRFDNIARREERQNQNQITKTKKVERAINDIQNLLPVRWGDIMYVTRYCALSDQSIDLSKISRILPYVHLAELEQLLTPNNKKTKEILWNRGDLYLALSLLEEIAKYQLSVSNEAEAQKIAQQVYDFLKYCKDHHEGYVGYSRIQKEIFVTAPVLRTLLGKR